MTKTTIIKTALAMACVIAVGGLTLPSATAQSRDQNARDQAQQDREQRAREARQRQNRQARPSRGGRDAGALGQSFNSNMQTLSRTLRSLQRLLPDLDDETSRSAALQLSNVAQASIIGAKLKLDTVPMTAAGQEKFGDDENAYRNGLRTHLIKTLRTALDLEMAVMEADADRSRDHFDKLIDLRDEGHQYFQPSDEERKAARPSREERPSRERPARSPTGR